MRSLDDIIALPIEFDRDKIDGRYRIVLAASQRAREIVSDQISGRRARGSEAAVTALHDVLSDKFEILTGDDAIRTKEIHKKSKYERMLDTVTKEEEQGEELTELEKDLKVYLNEKGDKESRLSIDDIFDKKKG
jgi:DNA-directed RNA polymerase subunit K/omega